VTHQTWVAVLVMCTSLSTAGFGALMVKRAHAIPVPRAPERRTVTGTVVDLVVQPCFRRRSTCFRPVVSYSDTSLAGGEPQQLVSRTAYSPSSPHKKGERVSVYIESKGGAAWLAREWDERQAERQRQYEQKRDFPLGMGWLLIGGGAFGLLLAAGIAFWVDRSGNHP
jgi:hypothetical protein